LQQRIRDLQSGKRSSFLPFFPGFLPESDGLDANAGLSVNLFKKRYYILFVSREADGTLNKVPVPLHYAYIFVAVAVIGLFTITGLAGSYSRMLIKMSYFNQVRQDRDLARANNAHLQQALHEKDIQAASLGSLASEVSALYGLTANKLALAGGHGSAQRGRRNTIASAPVSSGVAEATLVDDSYYKSVDTFNTLRQSAMDGVTAKALAGPDFGHLSTLENMGSDSLASDADVPALWPIMGPITSSFGQREDPVLNNGEGEFHTGVDISAVDGTPIHATGDGTIKSAGIVNGYGRMVVIDHGHGILTCYGHMSGFAVVPGETVLRGQVIGYVGHSGRVTGSHLHYEVRIRNTPVNPHKYLRITMAQLGSSQASGS
jgi:murein DD-endopeptidase MepM/ murein hydrolase activator NlpD